ncbi:MAG: ACT domain-containing protein [Acidobacteriaceae bacterium]
MPARPQPCCTATRRVCSPTTASTSEAPLNGTLVTIRNHDVPGVVGRIGTILGEHSLNIANFALGRSTRSQRVPQGQALAVVQIDVQNAGEATPAIEALRRVEAIASVRLVELGNS